MNPLIFGQVRKLMNNLLLKRFQGLHPVSQGLHPYAPGLHPTSQGLHPDRLYYISRTFKI